MFLSFSLQRLLSILSNLEEKTAVFYQKDIEPEMNCQESIKEQKYSQRQRQRQAGG
jgi:hypothetical protein